MANALDLRASLSTFPLQEKIEVGNLHSIQKRWDAGGWEFEDDPGVYIFYSADGEIIYIGKAKNLGERTGSYFRRVTQENGVIEPRHEWAILPVGLQMIRTDDEGIASYLEIHLIQALDPVLNIRK
jgi:excinuclease UvrABC nuclease subunit